MTEMVPPQHVVFPGFGGLKEIPDPNQSEKTLENSHEDGI